MTSARKRRPDTDTYFMNLAEAVASRADCKGRQVGAVLVLNGRVISTGYNGTPDGMSNCSDGGCARCSNSQDAERGKNYDRCICVHAEQNAVVSAARLGIPIEGAVIYTTCQPCFSCAKELLQAKVKRVMYMESWEPPDEYRAQYDVLLARFPESVIQMRMPVSRGPVASIKEKAKRNQAPITQELRRRETKSKAASVQNRRARGKH